MKDLIMVRTTGKPPGGGEQGEPPPGGQKTSKVSKIRTQKDMPEPEVLEQPIRRKYTTEYKLKILEEADACKKNGELGALLRREGLYYNALTRWRKKRDQGILSGLNPKKRGRKTKEVNPLLKENKALERENLRLQNRLRKAEIIIDVQKKISEILGIEQPEMDYEKEEC